MRNVNEYDFLNKNKANYMVSIQEKNSQKIRRVSFKNFHVYYLNSCLLLEFLTNGKHKAPHIPLEWLS